MAEVIVLTAKQDYGQRNHRESDLLTLEISKKLQLLLNVIPYLKPDLIKVLKMPSIQVTLCMYLLK